MSRMSEDFTVFLEETGKNAPTLLMQSLAKGSLDEVIPGFALVHQWSTEKVKLIIKAGRFSCNGSGPWADAHQALLVTSQAMWRDMGPFLVHATASGFCIGYYRTFPGNEDNDWDELMIDPVWSKKVGESANAITVDYDAIEAITKDFQNAVTHFSMAMGFPDAKGRATVHVWDLWSNALNTAAVKFFIAGERLGRKWAEEEILEGILTATDGSPEPS